MDKASRAGRDKVGVNDLGEALGLRPNAAVVTDDGGGAEMLSFDLAHQVLVDVRLPRHLAPRLSFRRRLRFFLLWSAWFARGVSVGRLETGGAGEYIGCVVCGSTGRGMEPYFSSTSLFQFLFLFFFFFHWFSQIFVSLKCSLKMSRRNRIYLSYKKQFREAY
jgi:hypothetical protein